VEAYKCDWLIQVSCGEKMLEVGSGFTESKTDAESGDFSLGMQFS